MEFDDVSEAVLYAVWLKYNENITETEDIKSAFHAGFCLAFKRMEALMELVSMINNTSDIETKN